MDNKAKHTPGPWHLRLSDNATPHIEHGDCHLDEVGELANRVCVMPAEIDRSYNSFANARLIAAAPELLDALKALEVSANTVSYCYDKRPENFAVALHELMERAQQARDLFAKATGAAA